MLRGPCYYTVDNLPLPLLRQFLDNPLELVRGHDRIAVVTDVRAPGFAERVPAPVRRDRPRADRRPTLLFLEASDEVLVRRFSETRRPHPLAPDQPVIEGIQRERELLGRAARPGRHGVRHQRLVDPRDPQPGLPRVRHAIPGEEPGMVVSLVSFGFKHGIPYGTDLLFDVRFLPNPHFVPGLREQTGQDAGVRDYLDRQPDFAELVGRLTDLLAYLLPRYRRENRSYLSVAIGCTGGRHRSVAVAERLRLALRTGVAGARDPPRYCR